MTPEGPAVAHRPPDHAALRAANDGLRELMLAGQDFRRAFADAYGIGLSDAVAMSHLFAAGPLTAGELATRLGVGSSTLTSMIDRLEHAGYVQRRQRREDRRSYELHLTDEGNDAMATGERYAHGALSEWDADVVRDAGWMLHELADALRRHAERFVDERPGPEAG